MTSNLNPFNLSRRVRFVITALSISLLWLASARVLLGAPRGQQDFVITTTSDFAAGNFLRTSIVNNSGGEVQLMPVGIAGNWITDTQQLPAPRMELAVVSAGGRIYAYGGVDATGLPQRDVYATTVVNNSLSAWTAQSNLPVGLAGHVGLVANAGGSTYIYAVGGFDTFGFYSDEIYYAPILGNGAVGTWLTNTTTLPTALNFAAGVVNKGRMYIIGGIRASDGTYRPEVYFATINANGSLGAWTATAALPQGVALTAAVIYNGSKDTIYVMGGATSATNNTSAVYFADVNGDGTLTAWGSAGTLPEAFSSHAAVQLNGQIYVIGGNSGGISSNLQPRNTVLVALIEESDPSRLLDLGGGTRWLTSDALPIPRRLHGATIVGTEIFTVGGDSSNDANVLLPSAITYHGSTTGVALRYAPTGNYLSPVINVGTQLPLSELSWSAVRTNVAATDLTMRYRTSNDGVNWSAWSALLPSSPQQSANINDAKPVSYPLNVTAQYFQTQAFFTSTVNSLTPYLTEIHLKVTLPSADLAVSKSGQQATVLPGQLITYTIFYTNFVGAPVTNVILTETVPANTTYVEAGAGWTPIGGNQYVKSVGSLGVGQTGNTFFVVRVNNPALGVPAIYNTVRIGGDPDESNLTNNTFTATTYLEPPVPGVELRVVKDDAFVTPRAGQVVTYTITYANFGTDTANSVTLTETLPAEMTFVGSAWTPIGGNQFTRVIGTVPGSSSGVTTFAAQIAPTAAGGSFLTNTVRIGFPGVDVNPNNNLAYDVDYVTLPNVRIFKYDDTAVVTPGQTTPYNFTVVNIGGSIANNVTITEIPPLDRVQVVSAPGWNQTVSGTATVYVKTFATLAPGTPINDSFTVRVLNSVTNGTLITNTATVRADNQDPAFTTGFSSRDVNVVAVGAPDLLILSANPNTSALVVGQPAQFTARVTNGGPGPSQTWFYVDMYVDRAPADRNDLGNTFADSSTPLAPGENRLLGFTWTFATPGIHQLYFQIDTCDAVGTNCFDPSYGRVPESNEANNIFGPISVTVFPTVPKQINLPLIFR